MGQKCRGKCSYLWSQILFYYFMITKTLNLSHEVWKLVYHHQYPPRKISTALLEKNIHTPHDWRKILQQLFIFMELKPFSYYFVIANKLNLSYEKNELVQLDQYPPRKISNYPWDNDIHTPHDGGNKLWQIFIFMELGPFFYQFMITMTLNLSYEKSTLVDLFQYSPIKISTTRWETNIHTLQYGTKILRQSRSMFLLFMITKTLNLSLDKNKLVQLDQYPPIIFSNAPWDNDIHTLQYGSKILWYFFIFMELEQISYYSVITKTLNLSHANINDHISTNIQR